MMYLLSVCIPTRNRPKELIKTVNEIERQIISLKAQETVEIVIAENTDIEPLKINSRVFQYSNIRFFDNKGNIGYAKNINKLILNAQGKFVWLLSDDDIVLDSAIEYILNIIKEDGKKEGNYITFSSGGIINNEIENNVYFKKCKTDYFLQGKDFLSSWWTSVIFLSINIFNREKMIQHANKYNLFNDTNDVYQNSLLCISFIDKLGGVKIINKMLLIDTYKPKTYTPYNSVNVPIINFLKLLIQLESLNICKECLRDIKKNVDANIVGWGCRFIIRKIETDDIFDYASEYKKIIRNNKVKLDTKFRAFCIYLLLKTNKNLAKFLIKLGFILKGKEKNYYKSIRMESIMYMENIKSSNLKISY